MHAAELRVGHVYAFPIGTGPWYRHAVPVRVMSRGPRARVLVLVPDGIPETPVHDAVPRGSLVWIDAESVACGWGEWPARAAAAREDMLVAVSSAVAAIGGDQAQELPSSAGPESGISRARVALNRWARPEPRLPASFDIR
jgi:hypothetical protein